MTMCEYLQLNADRCTLLATELHDLDLKRFYMNAAEGFRRRLEHLSLEELEAPCTGK